MPVAESRLERLQIKKLLQCVCSKNHEEIVKLVTCGVENLINFNDPDDGKTALISAVKNSDEDMIKLLLKLGANPDIVDFHGRTGLMHAAELGNTFSIKILLDAHANKNISDLEGQNVLFYCISPTERHHECLVILIDRKIVIDKQDHNGETVLLKACKKSKENEKLILELLMNGTNPNLKSKTGRTAFLEACASGSDKSVAFAIRCGADLSTVDNKGRNCVHEAALHGNLNVLSVLSGFGADFNKLDKDGNNPFHLSATVDEMCCRYLGQRGCDATIKNLEGKLPRKLALDEGKKLCAKEIRKFERLSSKKQKPVAPWALHLYDWSVANADKLGEEFALMSRNSAIQKENTNATLVVDELITESSASKETNPVTAVGSTPTNRPLDNETPNMESPGSSRRSGKRRRKGQSRSSSRKSKPKSAPITRLSVEEFRRILDSLNAPIDDTMMRELVKLHEKNADKHVDWTEFLSGKKYINKNYLMSAFEGKKGKKKKGNRGGRARKTKLPMDICILPKSKIYRRVDGGPPVMYIPKHINHTDSYRFNADRSPLNPLLDDSSWYLDTPRRQYISFHAAAMHDDLISIRLAIAEGYHVDTRDKYYKTPLMVAAHHGNLETATELIMLGADVNSRDNFKWTPLHHAAHSGMIDIVELLLNNGAQMEAKAMNGATPLFRAIECSKLNVVDFLLSKGAKLFVETRKGENPYVVALKWSDPRVIDHVHDKWELAQEKAEKQNKNNRSPRAKRASTAKSNASKSSTTSRIKLTPQLIIPGPHNELRNKLTDILFQYKTLEIANAIQDTRICLRFPWLPEPTRAQRLAFLAEARERYGWDHGIPDVPKQPFDRHLNELFKNIEQTET